MLDLFLHGLIIATKKKKEGEEMGNVLRVNSIVTSPYKNPCSVRIAEDKEV
jgi:hypothetical protein